MDRFVMSDPIPQEQKPLKAVINLRPHHPGVGGCWMPGECLVEGWDPQRRQVRLCAQVPPEPEVQFSDDLAVHLGTSPGGSANRLVDVFQSLDAVLSAEELPASIPGRDPTARRPHLDEPSVHSVPEHDFESAEILEECTAHPAVPVVQANGPRNVAANGVSVRAQASWREELLHCLRIER